jgi:predicted extracellular nuclease
LNAAAPAGVTYAFINASGVNLGTDAITNALIYRTDLVAPVGAPRTLIHAVFAQARPPLAQTFRQLATGEVLTVCINHFKSKGSASPDTQVPNRNADQGDGQGASNYIRTRQAEELMAWLATDPTGSGDPDVLVIGDLNSYAKEDPIDRITTANAFNPVAYINLTEHFEGPGGYSYAFDGAVGHLDHALASPALASQITNAQTWHANADEPVYLDYNLENKSGSNVLLNAGTAFRYSDHDPIVIGLNLDRTAPVFAGLTATPDVLGPVNHKLVPVTLTPDVVDAVDPTPTIRIISVTSNETANGKGDGNTGVDWEITGPLTLNLRAERSGGNKNGRVYTITVEAIDASGNRSVRTVTVSVPHDQ